MNRPLLVFALAVALTACASPRETPGLSTEGTSQPVPGAPGAAIELRQVSRVPRSEQPSLGHANKPNGWDQRYRRFVSSQTPAYVPREQAGLQLAITEPTEDGWLALYESGFAELGPNRTFRAVLFGEQGNVVWDLDLNRFLSRPTQLEIQDLRYADGKLYFSEACQSYAKDAGGDCSSLVRLDPAAERVDWRTPPLISSDIFLLHGPYVVSGYGFTNEEDFLYLVDRETGRVAARAPLDSAHDYLQVEGNAVWVITTQSAYLFRLPVQTE